MENNHEAQKKYYQKNREKLIKRTSEYKKKKRLEAKEERALLESILDVPKPLKKQRIPRKAIPLIIEVKTGKFIFDLDW
jgi:hypothetical protein